MDTNTPERARYLYVHQGLNKVEVEQAEAGEIIALAGLEGIAIGETLADIENPVALPTIKGGRTDSSNDLWSEYFTVFRKRRPLEHITKITRTLIRRITHQCIPAGTGDWYCRNISRLRAG